MKSMLQWSSYRVGFHSWCLMRYNTTTRIRSLSALTHFIVKGFWSLSWKLSNTPCSLCYITEEQKYFPVDLHVQISCNWENYPIFPLLTFPLKSYQLVDFHWITKTYFSIPMINYISRGTKRQFLFSNNIFGCVSTTATWVKWI